MHLFFSLFYSHHHLSVSTLFIYDNLPFCIAFFSIMKRAVNILSIIMRSRLSCCKIIEVTMKDGPHKDVGSSQMVWFPSILLFPTDIFIVSKHILFLR